MMERQPKFGIRLPTFWKNDTTNGPLLNISLITDYVKRAESLGFNSVFVGEHLLSTHRSKYYSATTWLEPLTVLSTIASHTHRVKLGTLVLILPLRHPLILAHSSATLDFLSNGRFILGGGVGYTPQEFEALGIRMEERGKRSEECIEVIRKLWTEESVFYDGRYYKLNGQGLASRPAQKHISIWLGGGLPAYDAPYFEGAESIRESAWKRIAKYADAWAPLQYAARSQELFGKAWKKISALAKTYGRDALQIELVYSNFIYLTKTQNGINAAAKTKFANFFSGSLAEARAAYLVGSPTEVIAKIKNRINTTNGVNHIILTPISFDYEQLDLIHDEITQNF